MHQEVYLEVQSIMENLTLSSCSRQGSSYPCTALEHDRWFFTNKNWYIWKWSKYTESIIFNAIILLKTKSVHIAALLKIVQWPKIPEAACWVHVYVIWKNCQAISQSGCTFLVSHQQCLRVPVSPHPSQYLSGSVFLILGMLVGVYCYLILVLVHVSWWPMMLNVFPCLAS